MRIKILFGFTVALVLCALQPCANAQKTVTVSSDVVIAGAKTKAVSHIASISPGFSQANMDAWSVRSDKRLKGKLGGTKSHAEPTKERTWLNVGAIALMVPDATQPALEAFMSLVLYHEFMHLVHVPGDGSTSGTPPTAPAAPGGNVDPYNDKPIICNHNVLFYHGMVKACELAQQANSACNQGDQGACEDLSGYCYFNKEARMRFDDPEEKAKVVECVAQGPNPPFPNFPQITWPPDPQNDIPGALCEYCAFVFLH